MAGVQNNALRHYFYYLDLHGRLFLHDCTPKNIATCLKDRRALNFFFRHIEPNTTELYQKEFPYISKCMGEINYLETADTPIVFLDVMEHKGDDYLTYGHSIKYPFDPTTLSICSNTGRMYHPAPEVGDCTRGLLRSSLGLDLSQNLHATDDGLILIHRAKEYLLREEVYHPAGTDV